MSEAKRVCIVRAPHERDYYVAMRSTAQDLNISYAALGLLNYLLSQPDTWQANVTDLAKRTTEYEVYKILRELRKNGYMTLSKEKGKGRFSQWVYQVFETKRQLLEFQQLEKQLIENGDTKRVVNSKRVVKKADSSNNTNTSGAGAPGVKTKKPAKIDPLFDAVALGQGIQDTKAAGGRIAKISNWLAGKYEGKGNSVVGFITAPAQPEHVAMFFAYWKKTYPKADPPMDFVKFVEQWRKWATSLKSTTRPAPIVRENEPVKPVSNAVLSEDDDE